MPRLLTVYRICPAVEGLAVSLARAVIAALVFFSVALAGCRGPAVESAGATAWVGTITTEDDVTTVRSESGSVWGGPAALVEEASIGVEAGEDAYMLGRVVGVAAAADRIYVADRQVPALRAYDWNGTWLQDFGRAGEGPGEFRYPAAVGVDGAGRVWLHDQISTRLTVFSASGEPVATLSLGGVRISGTTGAMVVTEDGQAYVFDLIRPAASADAGPVTSRRIMKPYDIDGVAGEPIEIPQFDNPAYLEAEATGVIRIAAIPFHPNGVTAFAPTRGMLSGYPDAYRFDVRHPDGARTVIERAWEPVAVLPGEAAAHQRAVTTYMRDLDPDWSWSGRAIPATKPAFSRFAPAVGGGVWVVRPGPATQDPDCDEADFEIDGEAHCWPQERIIDAFDADGRYLGEVNVPADLRFEPLPFIRGNDVIALSEDEAGTIRVKRYRLVPPRGSGP
jgi:hypothetical protein